MLQKKSDRQIHIFREPGRGESGVGGGVGGGCGVGGGKRGVGGKVGRGGAFCDGS